MKKQVKAYIGGEGGQSTSYVRVICQFRLAFCTNLDKNVVSQSYN